MDKLKSIQPVECTDNPEGVDIDQIREENRKMKEQRICRICKDKQANRLILPCTHIPCCELCILAVKCCPQCKGAIKGTVAVYFG